MNSLKVLAREYRQNNCAESDAVEFIAVVLECAHALQRGRKPNASSLLPYTSLQEYLQSAFHEVKEGYYNASGEEVSLADVLAGFLEWDMRWRESEGKRIARAINMVAKNVLRPVRKPSNERGDWEYQQRNKDTRLKRRREWSMCRAHEMWQNSHLPMSRVC